DETRGGLVAEEAKVGPFLDRVDDAALETLLTDLGGHDTRELQAACEASKVDQRRPTLIVAHTVKGWGMDMYAAPGNHSELPKEDEVVGLLGTEGLTLERPFEPFAADTEEGRYLAEIGARFRQAISGIRTTRVKNREWVRDRIRAAGGVPKSLDIDTKLFPRAHTQWMWGQLAAKLARIGSATERRRLDDGKDGKSTQLTPAEQAWEAAADLVLTM